MEFIYFSGSINFYLKLAFILFLFIFHLYLIFTYDINSNRNLNVLQSGFNGQRLKALITIIGAAGGFLSSYITVKNEIKDYKIGSLNQLKAEEGEAIRQSIDQIKEIHQEILTSLAQHREALHRLPQEKAKITGQTGRLIELHDRIKGNILSYNEKSTNSNSSIAELGVIDQLISRDLNKFKTEFDSTTPNIEEGETSSKLDSDIKESSIINTDFFALREWFDGLIGIKKLAFSLILGKSVILSSLVSIIFIFYGNKLIEKYDLVNRYPNLAKFIELRKKYQKYYFRYYCFLIFLVIIMEVIFGVSVLLL